MNSILLIMVVVMAVMMFSERLAKAIPDSKTGFLGYVRKGLKVIALYTENIT